MALLSRRQNPSSSLGPVWSDLFNLDRFFDDDMFSLRTSPNVPSVNVKENENSYDMEVAAPGLSKDDFDVSVDDNVLTISAEKEEEKKDEDENYTRREYNYNSFRRSFTLPENTKADQVKANYKEGVLYVTIPKKEEAQKKAKKKIDIK